VAFFLPLSFSLGYSEWLLEHPDQNMFQPIAAIDE
jgi:hypothetical protein